MGLSLPSIRQIAEDAVRADQTFDAHRASSPAFALEAARGAVNQRRIDRQQARDGALTAETRDLEILSHDPICGFAARERARLAQRFTPSMLHRVPHVSEGVVMFLDLEREKPLLQLLHRAIEFAAHFRLRVAGSELERLGLGGPAAR